MNKFVKFTAKEETVLWILEKRPTAYLLLSLAASRAKLFDDHPDKTLEIGEAFIGDHKSYGVTRQVYRDDLEFLEKNHLATTKRTNRGTIIKIASSEFFDFSTEEKNQQKNSKGTRKEPLTRKKEERIKENITKEKPEEQKLAHEFGEVMVFMSTLFPVSPDFKPSPTLLKNFGESRVNHSVADIKQAIKNASLDNFWRKALTPHSLFKTDKDNVQQLLLLTQETDTKMQRNSVDDFISNQFKEQ